MSKTLFSLILLGAFLGISSYCQQYENQVTFSNRVYNPISVTVQKMGKNIDFIAVNNSLYPYQVEIQFTKVTNLSLINQIMTRALNGCQVMNGANPAANYLVGLYTNTLTDQGASPNTVRFETKLELSEQDHRFFDLVRWGIAADYMNAYLQTEQTRIAI